MMNITRLGLAGIALTAWMVFWITKAIRAYARKESRAATGDE